ncbi:putative transposase family protein [Mycobacterium xenopi 4042]|uniref:Putative transposase family protein n=1 Tax=Mycobacterium xenopi 4042 TaxID=1299334 RepID=X7ZDR9_MYCXE|nr:putative transposase family protein [Mycobacterium xenopi 4042]
MRWLVSMSGQSRCSAGGGVPDGVEVDRIPAPKSLTAAQSRLRALQRRAARQHGPYDFQTGTRRQPSRRWRTTQARIGRTHAHAAAVRRDVLHKATTALAQQHQVIVVETLNAAGMRSAGGPASVASTVPWLMPPWPRCGACSATKLVGTVPVWRKPTGIFRHRRPARVVGGESQTSRWPTESSTASTAARGSIVIWVLRSTSPDSANPTGVNRVPPGVAGGRTWSHA